MTKPRPTPAAATNSRWSVPAICIFLAVITFVVFGQTLRDEFVNFDDNNYVYQNPNVTGGLTLKGIESAFRHGEYDNWVPLTTISHMLDCQLYGLNAGGHHLTNVLLHITSAILLFLVLRQMTGFLWRSAFVAAVFAVHPLHVESVAWIAERKDTLSGLFFMLTLGAYVHYVRRPASVPRYLTVLFLFACGLMSKPMLVTMPFVLLLLDYWPLNRFSKVESIPWLKNFSVPTRLVFEKIPLLALSIASCISTFLIQSHAIQAFNNLPVTARMGNAPVACITYVWQLFYPTNLAVLYPYPRFGLPLWKPIVAVIVLIIISLGVFLWRRERPYLLIGWLWYLGMLVPVIGLVQVGGQSRADRYAYLPQIGLCLMVVWLAADLSASWRNRRLVLSSLAFGAIIVMVLSSRVQASYWRNSETLWKRALAVTPNNYASTYDNFGNALYHEGQVSAAIIEYEKALATDPADASSHNDFGNALYQEGQLDEAIAEYHKAVAINPNNAETYNNLGSVLAQKGQVDQAIIQFQKALAINPIFDQACDNLGSALAQKGQADEAIIEYRRALAINPNDAQTCYNLGNALAQRGQLDEAIIQFQKALAIDPNYAQACYNLAYALLRKGQMDEAIVQFQKVLAISPDDAQACNDLGNVLAQKGRLNEAVFQFQKALAINPNYAQACNNLGSCLLQKGQMNGAIFEYQKALALQPGFVAAQNNLTRIAWMLATSPNPTYRNGTNAIALAQQTDRLTGGNDPAMAATLAAADAETGNFPEAITNVQRALRLASSQNNPAMVTALQAQLKCYQAGTPYHASATAR